MGTPSARTRTTRRATSDTATLVELERAARDLGIGDAVWRATVETLSRHLGGTVALYLVENGTIELRASALRDPGTRLGWTPGDGGPLDGALLSGRPAIFLPRRHAPAEPVGQPMICVPLRHGADVIGVLVAADARPGALSERDAWFLGDAARRIARWLEADTSMQPVSDPSGASAHEHPRPPDVRSVTWLEDARTGEPIVTSGAA
ncbi:MAG: GAF domain-containing protein [Candidatus Limnocylindria bacterium]